MFLPFWRDFMEIKIILFDLDFTLLHSDKSVSEYTVNVLKECSKKGILTGFCTSRGNSTIKKLQELINPDIVICNSGACVYYHNQLIKSVTFSQEETHAIFENAYSVFGSEVEMTCDTLDDMYWNRKDSKSLPYNPNALYDDFRNFNQPAMKICIQTQDDKKINRVIEGIENCDLIPFSDIPWYKLSPVNASKEKGIVFLSEYLKVPLENIVAFGDDFSDIGMLKMCGKGVAVANAIPQVREIADELTDSCDQDGVANWIVKAGVLGKQ